MGQVSKKELDQFASIIVDSAITVHREMGAGLLESAYHHCMIFELRSRSITVETNVPIPLVYKTRPLNKDFVIDVVVEREIIIELKAIEVLLPVHEAQLLSYLKLTNLRLGLSCQL